MKHKAQPCPCGRPFDLSACCGRYFSGELAAPDAEALMRSRYSAYALGLAPYLQATWHATTRPETLVLASEPQPKWIGLTIHRHEQQDQDHATVEFTARFRLNGRAQRMHEKSRFVREHGRWFYIDGEVDDDVQAGGAAG